MANRLASETSPYLLQHKDNPVDWYPWGDEAFAHARDEEKPIFLSVGYSACHWCHVMERESFENEEIAGQLNRDFVSIKVDREERPDVDSIYMAAVHAISGQGGWPMSVFLTPEGRPFFAGTYFPPEDAHGRPGFRQVLETLIEIYRSEPDRIVTASERVTDILRSHSATKPSTDPLSRELLDSAFAAVEPNFDDQEGGLGSAPKFPQPHTWEFLLRYSRTVGSERALHMVDLTLVKMARGACTTSWAAASTATPQTGAGSSPTSRRCSTTTPRCHRSTCTPG